MFWNFQSLNDSKQRFLGHDKICRHGKTTLVLLLFSAVLLIPNIRTGHQPHFERKLRLILQLISSIS